MATVTRKALIISNPGEEGAENFCKGVFVDVKNYTEYLQTPQGGLWSTNDIVHLPRPSKVEVRAAVARLREFDYSYVAFAGHGWHSSVERATVLTFRKGEELAYFELLADSSKRTLVLDCCRKVYHEPITLALNESRKMASLMQRRVPDPARCRADFLGQIERASRGVIVINSCSEGEKAGDDDTRGGRYTSGLLGTALRWTEEQATQGHHYGADLLSIVLAHEGAATDTRNRSGGTQNPTIEKPRGERYYFPFAVFA